MISKESILKEKMLEFKKFIDTIEPEMEDKMYIFIVGQYELLLQSLPYLAFQIENTYKLIMYSLGIDTSEEYEEYVQLLMMINNQYQGIEELMKDVNLTLMSREMTKYFMSSIGNENE